MPHRPRQSQVLYHTFCQFSSDTAMHALTSLQKVCMGCGWGSSVAMIALSFED